MEYKVWLMEGLSSQRDIIQGIKNFAHKNKKTITVFASHRDPRNEILSCADHSLTEPKDLSERLSFILDTVRKWRINALHAGKNSQWFEEHRLQIEAAGVTLTTGASGAEHLAIADDKAAFADYMTQHDLPAVPSVRISSLAELQTHISAPPFSGSLCVKPVTGIYGMGFWRFDNHASPMAVFNHPERRVVHPEAYLAAAAGAESFTPLVLMPYLPGPEHSVDILATHGEVLAAVGRRKEGALQYLENGGEAFDLACACARVMKADGLVNVQTRHDHTGKPVLLETNMRPSGGIGYTRHCGVNLPGLFAFYQLGLMTKNEVMHSASTSFAPAVVRSITDVIPWPAQLTNQLD